jgi:hypothetical protein
LLTALAALFEHILLCCTSLKLTGEFDDFQNNCWRNNHGLDRLICLELIFSCMFFKCFEIGQIVPLKLAQRAHGRLCLSAPAYAHPLTRTRLRAPTYAYPLMRTRLRAPAYAHPLTRTRLRAPAYAHPLTRTCLRAPVYAHRLTRTR